MYSHDRPWSRPNTIKFTIARTHPNDGGQNQIICRLQGTERTIKGNPVCWYQKILLESPRSFTDYGFLLWPSSCERSVCFLPRLWIARPPRDRFSCSKLKTKGSKLDRKTCRITRRSGVNKDGKLLINEGECYPYMSICYFLNLINNSIKTCCRILCRIIQVFSTVTYLVQKVNIWFTLFHMKRK